MTYRLEKELEVFLSLPIQAIKTSLSYFVDPDKRIFWGYWISAALISSLIFATSDFKSNIRKYILKKELWFSSSAIIDYLYLFFNTYIKLLFLPPIVLFGRRLAIYTEEFLISGIGYNTIAISKTTSLILYTICLTVVVDFFSFLVHYLMHKIPFLWNFHKIHHSARVLNPITQYRIHPLELILNNISYTLAFGITSGTFMYLTLGNLQLIEIIGVNIFHFVFLVIGGNLRHSHIPFRYFHFLEKILISPFQHQIHHSSHASHFNKNMGSKFAIWDWMFGTLARSRDIQNLTFGLGEEDQYFTRFHRTLWQPFLDLYNSIFKKKQ